MVKLEGVLRVAAVVVDDSVGVEPLDLTMVDDEVADNEWAAPFFGVSRAPEFAFCRRVNDDGKVEPANEFDR